MHLRHALPLLLFVGCTRTFTPAQVAVVHATGLALPNGTPLASGEAVVVGETIRVRGSGLESVRVVRFDAQSAQATLSGSDLAVTVPAPASGGEAQPAQVLLETDRGLLQVGELRLYPQPALQQVKPGPGASAVNAGGQAYLFGAGFSPHLSEVQVTFGDHEEAQAQVLSADPGQLLVSVPAGAPNGQRVVTVHIKPSGSQRSTGFEGLVSSGSAVVWKPISSFQVVPAAALPGETVRLLAPDPSAQDRFDHPLRAARDTDGGAALGSSTGATGPSSTGTSGNSGTLGSATGGSSGSTGSSGSMAGSGSTTGGVGPSNFGNSTFADEDAGAAGLGNDYPPDTSGTSPLAPSDQGAAIVEQPANAKLKVLVDAAETSARLQVRTDDNTFVVHVPALSAGPHQVVIADPAGNSPGAQLAVLPGHVTDPALYCSPAGPGLPADGLVARSLKSQASSGAVVIYGAGVDADSLSVAEVHPGGSLGPVRTVLSGALNNRRVIGAGRQSLFVAGSYDVEGVLAFDMDSDRDYDLPVAGASLGARALASVEPDLETPRAWALVAPDGPYAPFQSGGPAAIAWGGGDSATLDLSDLGPNRPSCTALAGALLKDRVTPVQPSALLRAELALQCTGARPWVVVRSALLPPTPGPLLPEDPDAGLGAGSASASFDQVQPGPDQLILGPGLLLAYNFGAAVLELGAGEESVDGAPAQVGAGAISPDGQQLALAGTTTAGEHVLAFFSRRTAGTDVVWKLTSSFTLADALGAHAITYDRSGGQVVLLRTDSSTGLGLASYCVAR